MKKRILITGVSSGIGYALAEAYLQTGAEVFGISRKIPENFAGYPKFNFQSVDLRHFEEIPSKLSEILAGVSALDLVILNAGILGKIGDMHEISARDLSDAMDVNVWANKEVLDAIFCSELPVRQVVAISSGAGIMAFRGATPYCISKAALNMMIALYAAERPTTHFSSIAPFLVHTPMQQQIGKLPIDRRFTFFETLRTARENGDMLSPKNGADLLIRTFGAALKQPSGTFINQNSSSDQTLCDELLDAQPPLGELMEPATKIAAGSPLFQV
ncbi:MAG: SDR family NAD(P)-dependent oxidoreductase [Verrucomicrobiota bacterium]